MPILKDKMLSVMADVNTQVAEREELIKHIAVALLTKKNLFILGDTGQAKSFAINEFRRRITGARQFERLLSKQADEEALFGRLDLASLIPGSVPRGDLLSDTNYAALHTEAVQHYENYQISGEDMDLIQAHETSKRMAVLAETIYALHGNSPKINTTGKIPDSHIIFLDEIFKANDGILNSLLTALNERVYTNEGTTVPIPAISFFSASNEIPDFSDPADKILQPLYDRFELKVVTQYVVSKAARLAQLSKKQTDSPNITVPTTITLQELEQMQREVRLITVSVSVNELMDDVLCELRRSGIHVSDRKYFNYTPITQAAAYLRGAAAVECDDLLFLKNYLWTKPEEITVIGEILENMCRNPIRSRVQTLRQEADECLADLKDNRENKRAFVKFRAELLRLFEELLAINSGTVTNGDAEELAKTQNYLETVSREGHDMCGFTYAPLNELKDLQ
jgi:MoxR-like ATPase